MRLYLFIYLITSGVSPELVSRISVFRKIEICLESELIAPRDFVFTRSTQGYSWSLLLLYSEFWGTVLSGGEGGPVSVSVRTLRTLMAMIVRNSRGYELV